ncbi:MAG: hypothetical protein ABSF44_02650 [Candidatus Bathyarchaeia archaeon]|jgi:hypothetical protein
MLKKGKKIGTVSRNSCARACETGVKEKMYGLAARLKQDGYEVVGTDLLPMACNIDAAKKTEYKDEVLVILACDSSVCTLQSVFHSKISVPR